MQSVRRVASLLSRRRNRFATCTFVHVSVEVQRTPASSSVIDVLDRVLDKGIVIDGIRLLKKSGGKSGDWVAEKAKMEDRG